MKKRLTDTDLYRLSPHDRYLRDPEFRALVETIESMIRQAQFSPTELREAVMLAAIRYEKRCSMTIPKTDQARS